ncbi:carbohydrate ABC transporter permease [Chelatococcus sp. GCM10030263]|uniref:carbohydrate ABC transporter permease n=1 Tax=Chelatococcus sp. GCM10030263 TaxID=3273387 RepID=UPI0036063ADB
MGAQHLFPSGPGRAGGVLRILNLPTIAFVIAFSVLPLAYVAYLSLQDLRFGAGAGAFAGLDNYRFVLGDPSVITAFWNTLYFSVLSVAIAAFVGLGIALLLDSDVKGAGWLVIATVLPWAIPEIVNALMWQWIYNPSYGALNGLLTEFGFIKDYQAWLSTPLSAMHAVVFAYSWKLVPFVIIILYAGLRSIPAELYESAEIDGAGAMAQFRFVTLPLLAPSLVVAVLFCVVWSMRAFDIVYLLTKGGPGEATTVLSYLVFSKAFDFGDLGAATAVACLLALLTFALTCLYIRVLPKGSEDQ